MAKKLDSRLLEILTKYGERPEDALWDCHNVWVAYHKAIERIAAKANIVFDRPAIIAHDLKEKTAVICVFGTMGERTEWSFGEAAPYNNKNGYPWAMAEKRAKDRVVLKLVGLHGEVYSEEEADDFQKATSASLKRADGNGKDAWDRLTGDLDKDLMDVRSTVALGKVKAIYRERAKSERWPKAWVEALKDRFMAFEQELESKADGQFHEELELAMANAKNPAGVQLAWKEFAVEQMFSDDEDGLELAEKIMARRLDELAAAAAEKAKTGT